MPRHNFRRLNIYHRAVDFALAAYRISKPFPREELYGLASQLRRAATSVSLNIAEGSGNSSQREFRRYLEIAARSCYEVMSCLEIAWRLGYCSEQDHRLLTKEADEIVAMIVAFSKRL